MKSTTSEKTQQEALQIAKATSRPGQTKEQTKLIAKGVEKGIAEYKKQQKAKARERDKAKKKVHNVDVEQPVSEVPSKSTLVTLLPWLLLVASWAGFIIFMFTIVHV